MASEKRGVLINTNSKSSQEVIKLRRDATLFGREKADIVLDDPEISSTHCQIQNIQDQYHIFDMNSTNGTYVNKIKIVKAKLKDGDLISLGSFEFQFTLEEEKKVRHLSTLMRTHQDEAEESRPFSIVDTLIQEELELGQGQGLKLRIVYANQSEETVEVKQKTIYLGRASPFGKFDLDPEISRKHLLIKLNDTGEIFVEDQGSTNGSYLNGKKLKGLHPVGPKDELKIGSSKIFVSKL